MNAIPTSAFSGQLYTPGCQKISDFRTARPRITMNDTACNWSQGLNKRLEELIQLPDGWDGYHARPVLFETAVFAIRMLERLYSEDIPMPFLVPGYAGDLQAEWHEDDWDIELHVLGPNKVTAWRSTPDTDDDGEELSLTNDFTKVGAWIQELAGLSDATATAAA
jgi:hypothetical protein